MKQYIFNPSPYSRINKDFAAKVIQEGKLLGRSKPFSQTEFNFGNYWVCWEYEDDYYISWRDYESVWAATKDDVELYNEVKVNYAK